MDSKNESLFTQIPNELMEILMSKSLNSSQKAVLTFIARKTYGFHKETDEISLTQFEKGTGLTRPTVVDALKKIQLVKLLKLVKKGNSRKASNKWLIDLSDWDKKLVKLTELVKNHPKKLVKPSLHTKENNKIKERDSSLDNSVVGDILTPEQYHDLMSDAEELSRVVVERRRR